MRETQEKCFLCRANMWEFDIESDILDHAYTLIRCVECDDRMARAIAARDLIVKNAEAAKELDELRRSEGATMDQGDGFYQ